jgi:putative ABC transport system permease protein
MKLSSPDPKMHTLTVARLVRTVRLGLKSLWMHRLRSLLTMLGIVFGVCSVIAMLAVGEGASHEAQEQIRALGSNNIILRSFKPTGEESTSTGQSYVLEYGLTYVDAARIQQTIPSVNVLVPARITRKEIRNGIRSVDGEVVGTVPWFFTMRNLRLTDGRFISDEEQENSTNVCVISASIVPELFPLDSPIGANLRVGTDYYRVVGVIEPESNRAIPGSGATRTASQDPVTSARVYIPLSAARSRFGEVLAKRSSGSFEAERVELHELTVQVTRQEDVEETAAIITQLLAEAHKRKDYEVVVPLELLRQAERTKQIFNIVLGAIAAISLLVGGIGIMNIMLASVTERTREIGIRRALGARKRDIIQQFLVETVLLSGIGGLIGVGLGLLIPFLIEYYAGMDTIVTASGPIAAFTISALVGVVFGIYPALRAANMDPVEALRHE